MSDDNLNFNPILLFKLVWQANMHENMHMSS